MHYTLRLLFPKKRHIMTCMWQVYVFPMLFFCCRKRNHSWKKTWPWGWVYTPSFYYFRIHVLNLGWFVQSIKLDGKPQHVWNCRYMILQPFILILLLCFCMYTNTVAEFTVDQLTKLQFVLFYSLLQIL